jgi:RNA polymerase subunit RPABC4/transcription elongation factor Spt4
MTVFKVCPNCGAEINSKAKSCPECGSDENTGWKDSALNEHPDVAEFDHEDYDELLHKEFGIQRNKPKAKFPWQILVVFVLVLLLVMGRLFI